MHLIKRAVALVALGVVPAAAFAAEPTTRPDGQLTGEVRLEGAFQSGKSTFVIRPDGDKADQHPGDANPPGQLMLSAQGLTFTFGMATREKGAYLGVSASAPPTVLRKQLNLTPGMSLVVDFVVPDSPACKAGLQKYDVLQKLDDQLIINAQQLAVLVRAHKPGDEIKLGIVHDGKPATLTAKLAEHDLEPLADEQQGDEAMIRLQNALPEPRVHPIAPGENVRPADNSHPGPPFPEARPQSLAVASVTWLDDGNSYTITTDKQGNRWFSVMDRDVMTVFEGPIDTKEQRDKLSPELKERLQRMESHVPGAAIIPEEGSKATRAQPTIPDKGSPAK